MKKIISLRHSLILMAVVMWTASLAIDQDEKKRYIEKSYRVSPSTELRIDNKFGKVEVNSWDKDEFFIKIEIVGKGKNEERAQRILDAIEIDIDQSSGEIRFETEIENRKNKNDEGFEINYTVYMPDANPLFVKNSFGDVTMADRDGDLELDVAYGSMKVGDIDGEAQLKLSFGSGSVGAIFNGEVTVKYSSLELESAGTVEFEQGFSDIEIGNVEYLELESKYGKVEIEKAHRIEADVHFSGFEIEELTGSLEMDCSYLGDFKIERLAKSFTLVDIDGKFGSYDIRLEPELNANIEAEFSFADLKYSSEVDVDFNYRVKESNKSYYKGKIGNGDPKKLIKVDSGYGNLRLGVD